MTHGEEGQPGQPGEEGTQGGGHGGAGGKGGRGGAARRVGTFHAVSQSILIILVTVGLVLGLAAWNAHLHDIDRRIEEQSCLQSRKLAENQRNVMLILSALATNEFDRSVLRSALADIPAFNCERR